MHHHTPSTRIVLSHLLKTLLGRRLAVRKQPLNLELSLYSRNHVADRSGHVTVLSISAHMLVDEREG